MEEGREKEELRDSDRGQAPYSSEAERFNHAAFAFEERSQELCVSCSEDSAVSAITVASVGIIRAR